MTVFTVASFVSNTWNYAFTIAGATGHHHLASASRSTRTSCSSNASVTRLRHGRSLVNAAPRSFNATWRTIVAANFISLLAAVVLFWLSVGSVKGFALYLGLTTVCDLLVVLVRHPPGDVPAGADAVVAAAQATKAGRRRRSERRHERRAPRSGEPTVRRRSSPSVKRTAVGSPRRVADGDRLRRPPQVGHHDLRDPDRADGALAVDAWPQPRHRLRGRRVVGRAGRERSRSTTPTDVLEENGLSAEGARIQERSSESGTFIKVQVGDQPAEVGDVDASGVRRGGRRRRPTRSTSTSSARRGGARSPRRRSGRW